MAPPDGPGRTQEPGLSTATGHDPEASLDAAREGVAASWFDPLAHSYRRWGFLKARIDDLGRLEPVEHPDIADARSGADEGTVARFDELYAGSIGYEFMHMADRERASWVASWIEGEAGGPVDQGLVLKRLMQAELFERFLQKRYVGSKRYSLEGNAALIPLLDAVLDQAAAVDCEVALIGMSHRGRLNVMVNLVGVLAPDLFADMEDVDPKSVLGSGDVKYHMGATGVHLTPDGREVDLHLVSNPSHLEAVNPVLMGRTLARQTRLGEGSEHRVLPICIHGDAAFAGQGVTAETLNLMGLPGYDVGGTVHIIANNLIGFTTEPASLHAARYSSSLARRLDIPILHVNGEDPDAVVRAGRFALAWRHRFGTDVVIDLVGYRRYGHSEVEDPTTTSPKLYEVVDDRPMLYELYAERTNVERKDLEQLESDIQDNLASAQEAGRASDTRPVYRQLPAYWDPYGGGEYNESMRVETGVEQDRLREVGKALTRPPEGFHVHPKLQKLLDQRQEMVEGERPVDFGMAELLAHGSLLQEGHLVRLSGQDSRRGTFNQRNAVLFDHESGQEWVSLASLAQGHGRYQLYNSPLSEAAVVGFEYGFSRDWPDGLVAWEAQFGDFANGAQIHIDQFIAAGEDKWGLLSGVVLLLPHGYEGQGPEHSSARMERFLQLAAEHNIQVCQPSTAAQHFHLLRRQVHQPWRKPLVVFTPKGMLRAKPSSSEIDAFTSGGFRRLIGDDSVADADRVLLCSGKIAHQLRAEREERGADHVAVVTLEQVYPFPEAELREELRRHASARKLVWVQEEPANTGALWYVRPELKRLSGDRHVTTIKRSASASPATGSPKAHRMEQQALIEMAFA